MKIEQVTVYKDIRGDLHTTESLALDESIRIIRENTLQRFRKNIPEVTTRFVNKFPGIMERQLDGNDVDLLKKFTEVMAVDLFNLLSDYRDDEEHSLEAHGINKDKMVMQRRDI